MSQRLYLVTGTAKPRLVRARHPATALAHVAKHMLAVRVASAEDVVEAMMAGIKPENAGDEPAPQADPPANPVQINPEPTLFDGAAGDEPPDCDPPA